jgi:hypothetical protein
MSTSSGPARVDFHHHIFPSGELAESLQSSLVADSGRSFPGAGPRWTQEMSLAFMDGLGIQTAVLSLPNDLAHGLPAGFGTDFPR